MDVVFGPEGLADADTSVLFEEKSTQVVDEMKDHPPLCNCFEKQMKPHIQSADGKAPSMDLVRAFSSSERSTCFVAVVARCHLT
jgi:hypothetical protein